MDHQQLPIDTEISFSELKNTVCLFEKAFNNSFRLTETLKKEIEEDSRIAGDDLFSIFTANIIKLRKVFTR